MFNNMIAASTSAQSSCRQLSRSPANAEERAADHQTSPAPAFTCACRSRLVFTLIVLENFCFASMRTLLYDCVLHLNVEVITSVRAPWLTNPG